MDEIVSLVVANGIFAVLFCGLLIYELKDSRNREDNYAKIIRGLNERLKIVEDVKSDTEKIMTDIDDIKTDIRILRSAQSKKHVKSIKESGGGGQCETLIAV